MFKRSRGLLLSAVAAAAIAAPVLAQTAGDAPPGPPQAPARVEVTAGQRHLMKAYGLSAAEAAERLSLEAGISQLAERLGRENPDDFGGVWIEHEPTYKIVVAFKSAELRNDIRETVQPELRRYVQIRNVRTSARERDALTDRIVAALAALGVDYVSYYEHRTDDMVIEAGSDASVGRIRQALPTDLQSFVKIVRGNVPQRTQASGQVSGDSVYPGWWFSAASGGGYSCTFAFAAKDNLGRPGILTAAHCPNTPFIYYSTPTPHWVSLSAPQAEWNAPNTKYDYQFHRTDGLASGAWLSYDNSSTKIYATDPAGTSYKSYSSQNVISGYASSGYFKVVGTYGYTAQVVGNVMCKTGHSTGLTCGQITHGWYTFNGAKGWIETGNSTQFIYATWGDSGGAVFTSPTAAGDVKAAGISTAATIYDPTPNPDGSTNNSGDEKPCLQSMENSMSYPNPLAPSSPAITDCRLVHMPIDYVDDQQLITIVTQPAS